MYLIFGVFLYMLYEKGEGGYMFFFKKKQILIMNCRLSVCLHFDGFSLLLFQVYWILIIKNRDFNRKKLRHNTFHKYCCGWVDHTNVSAVYLVHLIEEIILRWYAIPKHFLIQIHACIKVNIPQPSALTCNDL
jgi:hypothetical protein